MPSGPVALLGSRDERDMSILASFKGGAGRESGFGGEMLLDFKSDWKNELKRLALLMSVSTEDVSNETEVGALGEFLIERI